MAKLGDLVVRIGADTRDLNRQLGRVQRNMRSMTSNFIRLGESMTRSVTLPIVGIGAAAVKSAADLETLETSFVSLTGGADQARAMMEQLNAFTAKTPFQIDAVAKSARQLIASGTGIEDVNSQLQFLGDIAATTGVSIDEIAAIFAKVNAKGKVELENLNQLAERGIPIFKALSEATGLPADKLGAGAVSVRDFNRVLKSFAEEGGFAAGAMERLSNTAAGKFSTAIDNVKIALASLGDLILPKVTKLLDKITDMAQGFAKLDPNIRALIVNLGLLAAAFGPVLAYLPQIVTQIKLIMETLSGGGIAVAIAALGVLITTFATLRNEVVTIQDRLNDAQRDANENAAKSIADVRVLVAEFKKEGTQMERKEEILRRLQQISPRYYGHLKDATVTVDLLTAATERYTESIKAQARQQAIQEAQTEQYTAIANAQRRVLDAERERLDLLQELDTDLDGIVSLQEAIDKPFKFESYRVLGGVLQARQAEVDRLTQELLQFEEQFNTTGKSVNDLLRELEGMNRTMDEGTETVKEFAHFIPYATHAIEDFSAAGYQGRQTMGEFFSMLENVHVPVTRSMENTATAIDTVADSWSNYVNIFSRGVDQVITGSMTMKQAVISAIKDIILARLAESKANVLSGATSFAASLGPAAPFVIASTLAGMMAIVNRFNIPALAEGGLAFGPSMALIGDNRNARVDPEVIAPLSKLKEMMGGNSVEVYGRISGSDIYISNSRTATQRERYS